MCILYLCVWGIEALCDWGCIISPALPNPPSTPIYYLGWSDGVIIPPASGYGKWPHALFTYAKILIDDSFIYKLPQCQSHFSLFLPLTFNPLFWRGHVLMSLTHSQFLNVFTSLILILAWVKRIGVELGLIIHVGALNLFNLLLKLVAAPLSLLFPQGSYTSAIWNSSEKTRTTLP